MSLDTPVSERFQEQFEQAVRDVLGGLSQAEFECCRELPPPRQEAFDLACAPELSSLSVVAVPTERTLGVTLYFRGVPDGEVPVVPDDGGAPAYGSPARVTGHSPTSLGELGGGYAALSTSIVETVAAYCDAPASSPRTTVVEDEADLLCTSRYGDLITFSLYTAYPEYVEQVYSEGRRELAERYGLPF